MINSYNELSKLRDNKHVIILFGFTSLILLGLIFLKQFSLLFATLYLLVISLVFARAPIFGVLLLLAASTTTGVFNRISLFLADKPSPFDYIRASIEILVILIFIKAIRSSKNIGFNSATKRVDFSVSAYFLFSTLYAFNIVFAGPKVTIWGWRWVCLPILLYFVGRKVKNPKILFRRFFKISIVLFLILSIYAVYQAAVGLPTFERAWFDNLPTVDKASSIIEGSMFIAGKPRLPSMTANHVSFTLLAGFLYIWILFTPRSIIPTNYRILQMLAIFMASIYLILTLERSAIGMIIVGVVIILFINFRRRAGRLSILIILPVLVVSLIFMSQIDVSKIPWAKDTIALRRIAELANPLEANTVQGRANVIWPIAIDRFRDNPLGYGLGTFHTTRQNQALGFDFFIPPHNMYLQIALETGFIGLVIFLVFVINYSSFLVKAYFTKGEKKITAIAIASFIAILLIGMVNYPLESPLALFFWFLTGATVTLLGKNSGIHANKKSFT